MLEGREADGISAILQSMEEMDLLSLASTVTKHLIVPETKEEAIKAICLYSPNALSILKRKKIKKELIFKYLHDEDQVVSPVAEKQVMIKAVLNLWNSEDKLASINLEEEMEASNYTVENSWEFPSIDTKDNSSGRSTDLHLVECLGNQFVAFFYSTWRAEHPRLFGNETVNKRFGPGHFWPDCKCSVTYISPGDKVLFNYNTGQEAVTCFREILLDKNLILNPNTTAGGIRSKMNRHGLATICVNGTVHNMEGCVGLFEQTFGLMEFVSENDISWKVKFTNLNMNFKVSGEPCAALPESQDNEDAVVALADQQS